MKDPRTTLRGIASTSCATAAELARGVGLAAREVERLARFSRGRLGFTPRNDDIWVATYPRSGTTWMLYLLYHLVGAGRDDFEHLEDVCPWFERSLAAGTETADTLDRLPSPRLFKTHLLPRWLPCEGRFVYVRREGPDVALSYYELYQHYLGYRLGLESFLERFFDGDLQYGSWFAHVEQWSSDVGDRAVLTVEYERLRGDPIRELARVAEFVGVETTDERLREVERAASLERMRANQAKFDHATTLLRERGVQPGHFIGKGSSRRARDGDLDLRFAEAARRRRPRARLVAFLR
jgi:hypothetical protein